MAGTKAYSGRIVEVHEHDVRLPGGARARFEVVRHPGGAAIVALDASSRVCLLRQYRYAVGQWLWEIPAGKLDGGEAPRSAAERELAEEAGVRASRWTALGRMVSSPGVFTEQVHLFLAEDLEPLGEGASPAPDEVFELHWVALADALARARDGDIDDAKTVVALWRAAELRAVRAR